eukprot:120103_1
MESESEFQHQFIYRFDLNFTFLHSFCGPKKAQKIKEILDHPAIILLAISSCALSMWKDYFVLFGIIWLFLKHLLLNKTAFKHCIWSFDYWIKIGYGFVYRIVFVMDAIVDNDDRKWLVWRSAFLIFVLLITSYISALDAVHLPHKKQLMVSVSTSLCFTALALVYQFTDIETEDDYYTISYTLTPSLGVHTIATHSYIVSSTRILAIFFWKQSHKTWKSKGNKAVALSKTPTIIWFDSVAQQKEADAQTTAGDMISVNQMTIAISSLPNKN